MAIGNLRQASFRGVMFEVSSTTLQVGRRVQVFEYPQRDVPFVEDLGKSARTITMEAYIAGPDYIARMKKLIEVCEKEGSGRLIDPWLGAMTVTPKSLSSPKFDSNNLAAITLEFVESGEFKYPNSILDPSSLCTSAANALLEKAGEWLSENFDLSGVSDFICEAVGEDFASFLSTDGLDLIATAFEVADELSELANDVMTLVEGGGSVIAQRLCDVFGLGNYVSTALSWSTAGKRLSKALSSDKLSKDVETQAGLVETSQKKIQTASGQIQTAIRLTLIADLAVAAANIGGDLDRENESAPERVQAYDDLIEIRTAMLEAVDEELLRTEDDEIFQALQDVRSAIYQAITERAESSARLVTVMPPSVMPALVFAYDYYGDASRDLEIVERNKIRHAGFVPAIGLKLLNE